GRSATIRTARTFSSDGYRFVVFPGMTPTFPTIGVSGLTGAVQLADRRPRMGSRDNKGRTARSDAKASIARNAIETMSAETFDQDDWFHLGAATNTVDLINDHDRLLRRLRFGDRDYLKCIYQVLPEVPRFTERFGHGGSYRRPLAVDRGGRPQGSSLI
ncbi:MAG: hypothetical protein WAX14_05020, partial [Rhodococcus sp. (in: high G+C Gram-positive bacteria)]|uniref:hypothetical protein n=1 Tax=Rhodococcus sp. TaxID=1831 RepID=UPI003BB5A590